MAWLQPRRTISKEKFKVFCIWGKNNPKHQQRLGADWQSSSPAETELIVDAQMNRSQQCTLITNQTKHILSNTDWLEAASRCREYFLLCSALVRPYLEYSPVLAQPVQKGCGETGTGPLEDYQAVT